MAYVNNNEEVKRMPGMDGSGPMGRGSSFGSGFGRCRHGGWNPVRFGPYDETGAYCTAVTKRRNALNTEKAILQERLATVEKRLEELK
jgi:hypothetical protein